MLVRLIDVTLPASSLSCTETVEKIARFDGEGRPVKRDVMTKEEFDMLCGAIAKLAPQRRKVLMLRVFYECSTRQIAELLNMPLGRVHFDLARALEVVHAARVRSKVDRGPL